jgi:hypothetical protein
LVHAMGLERAAGMPRYPSRGTTVWPKCCPALP